MPAEERPPLELDDVPPFDPPAGFRAQLEAAGASVSDETLSALGAYLARLLDMNRRMNLTSVRDPEAAWERHIFDSLTLLPLLAELEPGAKVIDVGSGGGLPGIPIAIARPDLRVTLVESTRKKAGFLKLVSESLGLSNVDVRDKRAEQIGADLAGRFDVATARAVGRLSLLVPLTAPFVKRGGRLLLIKGQRAPEELVDAKKVLQKEQVRHEDTVLTPTGRIVVLRCR